MKINERFPDFLLASTDLNLATIAGLGAGTAGPRSFAGVTMPVVADAIAHVDAGIAAEYAIPSVFAHIASFGAMVQDTLDALAAIPAVAVDEDSVAYQNYLEWRGLVEMMALRHVYTYKGLNLSILEEVISTQNPIERATFQAMKKDPVYQNSFVTDADGVQTGRLFYICQNGKPFAIYHPLIAICPLQTYDKSLFAGVLPWFDANKDGAKSGHDCWTDAFVTASFCKKRVAWWALQNNAGNNALLTLARLIAPALNAAGQVTALKNQLDPLALNAPFDGQLTGLAAIYGQPKASAFCSSAAVYSANGEKKALYHIFTDYLFLSQCQSPEQNKLRYNKYVNPEQTQSVPVVFKPGSNLTELDNVAPLPPVTAVGAKVLQSECMLLDLSFTAKNVGGYLDAVVVVAEIQTPDGESLTLEKTYPYTAMFHGTLPYITIWPFVPLPADRWNKHYLTGRKQSVYKVSELRPVGESIWWRNPNVKAVASLGEQHVATVNRTTADTDDAWDMHYSDKTFRYAVMEVDDEEVGAIFVPQLNAIEVMPNANPIKVAIDLGTTSTLCAIKHPVLTGDNPTSLTYCDYSECISTDILETKEKIMHHQLMGMNVKDGHQGKAFTVAQLFDGWQDNKDIYYVEGRHFLVNSTVLHEFVGVVDTEGKSPLAKQNIYNDLKFGADEDLKINRAVALYLAGICQQVVLYALKNRCVGPYELRVSYLNESMHVQLEYSWRRVRGILQQALGHTNPFLDAIDQIEFCSQAQAIAKYQQNPMLPLASRLNLISVDIGGGTTDISITRSMNPAMFGTEERKTVSVKYAGREVMASSIIQYYAKCFQVNPASEHFANLWNGADSELVEQFKYICLTATSDDARRALVQNASLQMSTEVLLNDATFNIGDSKVNRDTRFLRRLITLKFLLIFRIVAQSVVENISLFANAETGCLDADLPLAIAFTGAGAQSLQYVVNASLDQFYPCVSDGYAAEQRVVGVLEEMLEELIGAEKLDGHKVVLQLYIEKDVAEKKEVAYGMLAFDQAPSAPCLCALPWEEYVAKKEERMAFQQNLVDTLKGIAHLENPAKKVYSEFCQQMLRYADMLGAYITPLSSGLVDFGLGCGSVQTILDLFQTKSEFLQTVMSLKYGNRLAYLCDESLKPYVETMLYIYLMDEEINSRIAEAELKG